MWQYYALGAIIVGFLLLQIVRQILSKFNQSYWEENAQPSYQAKIVEIVPEKVMYMKNDAKFKTVVKFSDGFCFVTHYTNRTDHMVSYDIKADIPDIVGLANVAHRNAVEKKLG